LGFLVLPELLALLVKRVELVAVREELEVVLVVQVVELLVVVLEALAEEAVAQQRIGWSSRLRPWYCHLRKLRQCQ
jgi:hypothetical protein